MQKHLKFTPRIIIHMTSIVHSEQKCSFESYEWVTAAEYVVRFRKWSHVNCSLLEMFYGAWLGGGYYLASLTYIIKCQHSKSLPDCLNKQMKMAVKMFWDWCILCSNRGKYFYFCTPKWDGKSFSLENLIIRKLVMKTNYWNIKIWIVFLRNFSGKCSSQNWPFIDRDVYSMWHSKHQRTLEIFTP